MKRVIFVLLIGVLLLLAGQSIVIRAPLSAALASVATATPGAVVTATPRTIVMVATPTPGADVTATPRTIVVVATPTLGPAAPAADDELEARRIAVYERVAPAVVNITTQVLGSTFYRGVTPEEGSGSGFLWDTQGHIVTNNHVIQGAQRIEVSFGGDASLPATVVGADPINDLAVIKVDTVPADVQPMELGTSDALKVGQTAIVIGNPFGQFERTMTQGIISAVNRTIETDSTVLRGVIQTDAAINRGNSGGPLLDSHGRLIGVNSAIYSPTGTSAGVGLAIPVDKVQKVIPVLIEQGAVPAPLAWGGRAWVRDHAGARPGAEPARAERPAGGAGVPG